MVVLEEVHYVLRRLGKLGFWVNWGKAFSLRVMVELWIGKGSGWRRIVSLLLGMKRLKMCVVDAFVYGLVVSIESLGVLSGFCNFNVNLLEVSL